MVKCISCKCSCYFIRVGELYCSKYNKILKEDTDICDENVEDINNNFDIRNKEE